MDRRQACLLLAAAAPAASQGNLPAGVSQPWLGPDYWANPLQDWRLHNGRMECINAGGDRNVFLLTREAGGGEGSGSTLEMRVKLGRLSAAPLAEGFAGFRVGIRGFFNDYRDSAVFGCGVNAGVLADGRLFIGSVGDAGEAVSLDDEIELRFSALPSTETTMPSSYDLALAAFDRTGATRLGEVRRANVPEEWIRGGLGLVCHSGRVFPTPDRAGEARMTMSGVNKRGQEHGGTLRFWFREWRVEGSKVTTHPERALGPIAFTLYTAAKGVLKLTAQMMPVAAAAGAGDGGEEKVQLAIRREGGGGDWTTIGSAAIDPAARTATFRVPNWNHTEDIAYRVSYRHAGRTHTWDGTVRRDPVHKDEVTVAGLSCNNDLGFPHADIVRNVAHFQPDLIAFTGDQIYERCGGYGIQRAPFERATLDYLRKWYLFGWEYRDLIKDIPCVCLPDDHDVYHGNIWGAGGRKAEGPPGPAGQDSGGFIQAADWVNMVQRTQTSHMPDAFDPAPVDQNIGVYYCSFPLGGVSFAVIEDRKWKSAPRQLMPEARIVNGWIQNPQWNAARDGDVQGAELLGKRQLDFLDQWAADWRGGVWMKCAISQTIFTNLATLPKPANTDAVTPGLPVEPVGGHARDEVAVADHDSNGWPQSGRNAALRALRKGFAFHIAGDQHLGSTVQYGIDEWNDASWAVCVPAVANIFPRRWYPPQPGRNAKPHDPRCTGEFLDGFGNRVTVHAVFNPKAVPFEPTALHQRAPGYGIIRFHRRTRRITVANWPRWVDAREANARPCAGWPVEIDQAANGMPSAFTLGEVKLPRPDVVVQVLTMAGEVEYTIRARGDRMTPGVRRQGRYRIRWQNGEEGGSGGRWTDLRGGPFTAKAQIRAHKAEDPDAAKASGS